MWLTFFYIIFTLQCLICLMSECFKIEAPKMIAAFAYVNAIIIHLLHINSWGALPEGLRSYPYNLIRVMPAKGT